MGLSLCLKPGEAVPGIFKDPIYSGSKNFRLSTSNLFPGENIVGTGFGSVVPDGYGMNYKIHKNKILMGVESKFSCPETSTPVFIETLKKTMVEVMEMCEGTSKAKL
jgi:carnitine O-acetyltransferase